MSKEKFLELNLVRHGSCTRCGDCCKKVEFEIPNLWVGGRCRLLLGDECVVWGSDECPNVCRDFPLGTEDYLFKKWLRGERLDFKPLLPNCPFWFEIEESSTWR